MTLVLGGKSSMKKGKPAWVLRMWAVRSAVARHRKGQSERLRLGCELLGKDGVPVRVVDEAVGAEELRLGREMEGTRVLGCGGTVVEGTAAVGTAVVARSVPVVVSEGARVSGPKGIFMTSAMAGR